MDLNKSMIGLKSDSFTFRVEKRHVHQFAMAIGDNNPLYTDEGYAKESAYEGLIVPPTFPIAINGDADEGEIPLKLDHRRMLHGEQEFEYYHPIRVGDKLHCQTIVSDIYEREGKSGKMQFLVLSTELRNANDELVCISKMNIIYRSLSKA